MSVATEILRTWRAPRSVLSRVVGGGKREDRAAAYLMMGALLTFVAQWPWLSRTAFEAGDEVDRLIAYGFLFWIAVFPLCLYGLALLLHVVRKLAGGQGTPYTARVAVFWALLATTPATLLFGLALGFLGPSLPSNIAGGLAFGAFVLFTAIGLAEGGRTAAADAPGA